MLLRLLTRERVTTLCFSSRHKQILQLGGLWFQNYIVLRRDFLDSLKMWDAMFFCKIRYHTVDTLELDKKELSRVDGQLERVALLNRLHFLVRLKCLVSQVILIQEPAQYHYSHLLTSLIHTSLIRHMRT